MSYWDHFLRWCRFWWQRRTRGWDDSDTWNLDGTTASFLLPRLRRFRELTNGHPPDLTWEEWTAMLDDMIYALGVVEQDTWSILGEDGADWARVDRGLKALGERWRALWW